MTGDEIALTLVVFAYDEATNVTRELGEILRWLRARRGSYQLVFVDDGSTDATRALAASVCAGDAACLVLGHADNRGIGAALKTGVRAATQPWVTFLPCDGQIPVRELERLLDAAASASVRVVFSVYRARDDGWIRTSFSASVRALIRSVHGVSLRSDGPYLFRRELFDADLLKPDTFFLNFEFPIRMLRAREPSETVTVECVPRRSGSSKSTGWRRVTGVARDLIELRFRLAREAK